MPSACFDMWACFLDLFLQLGSNISCLSCISRPLFIWQPCIVLTPMKLTFHLICHPRRTLWRLWERKSVGWHAVHMMPSTPTLPSLLVRLNVFAFYTEISDDIIMIFITFIKLQYLSCGLTLVKLFTSFREVKIDEIYEIPLLTDCHEEKTLILIFSYLHLQNIGTCLN